MMKPTFIYIAEGSGPALACVDLSGAGQHGAGDPGVLTASNQTGPTGFVGPVRRRGDAAYERVRLGARRGADWNARALPRYPEYIVEAVTDGDVSAAVRLARREGLTVKARSGGHSWTDSSVRDGSVLIDLSLMNQAAFDFESGRGVLGPGAKGHEIEPALERRGFYFPTGGCLDIGLGGFLLQGGFGFNRTQVGPACLSVRAVDVVLATGELVRADEHHEPDLFWAARGAGPGFFGVVTRFYVELHRLPEATLSTSFWYPIELAGEVLDWMMDRHDAGEFGDVLVGLVALPAFGDLIGAGEPVLVLRGSVSAASQAQARSSLAVLDNAPRRERVVRENVGVPVRYSDRHAQAAFQYPDGLTYIADNIWSDAGRAELAPRVVSAIADLPTSRSHVWVEAYRPHALPPMAFSMEGRYYVALYGVGDGDASQDELAGWATRHVRQMEHLAKGIQFADENLALRPANGLAAANAARLEELRARYDPDGLFKSYLLPDEAGG
jgi:FAD/FMN-containing dehydrogenase